MLLLSKLGTGTMQCNAMGSERPEVLVYLNICMSTLVSLMLVSDQNSITQ